MVVCDSDDDLDSLLSLTSTLQFIPTMIPSRYLSKLLYPDVLVTSGINMRAASSA